MRVVVAGRALLSGIVVYVAMAACAGRDTSHIGAGDAGGGVATAVLDAIANPVGEALAAPTEVATEQCNKQNLGGMYAEHLFPGLSEFEIAASVVVLVRREDGNQQIPPEYQRRVWPPTAVRDGAAIWTCVTSGGYESVTFVRR